MTNNNELKKNKKIKIDDTKTHTLLQKILKNNQEILELMKNNNEFEKKQKIKIDNTKIHTLPDLKILKNNQEILELMKNNNEFEKNKKIKIDNTKINTLPDLKILKKIKEFLEQNKYFQKKCFETIENLDGHLEETVESVRLLFIKHLEKSKCFESASLNQSTILIIDNYRFGFRLFNSNRKSFLFRLFTNSEFPIDKEIEKRIDFYNSIIIDTLVLSFDQKKQVIIPYFLTYNDLLIENKNKCKNENSFFNFNLSDGITSSLDKTNKSIIIRITAVEKTRKEYLLSNQIKKLEQ